MLNLLITVFKLKFIALSNFLYFKWNCCYINENLYEFHIEFRLEIHSILSSQLIQKQEKIKRKILDIII